MLKPQGLLIAALLAGACGGACRAAPEPPIVVVDSVHAQIGQPEGRAGLKYSIGPTSVLKVDARTFDFSTSLFPAVRPNAIQLVIGKSRSYSVPWDPSGLTTLSAATLTPVNDSSPYSGLHAGDEAILAIGEQRIDRQKNEIVLKTLWVGLVDVRD